MDSIRGYFDKVAKIVSSVIDEADNAFTAKPDEAAPDTTHEEVDEVNSTVPSKIEVPGAESEERSDTKGLFDWLPGFQNSAQHYLNSLASFDIAPVISNPTEQATPQVITEEPADDFKPTTEANPGLPHAMEEDASKSSIPNWLNSVSNRSEEVWKHIKQDFNEMITAASKEPKEMAASIYQQISAATVEASNKIDISNFQLLPEKKVTEEGEEGNAPDDVTNAAEFPSLSDLRDDVKKLVNDFVVNLFGSDAPRTVSGHDRREARLQILRADPATYEVEPPLPPAHLHLHSYTDWRTAYFDEATCQPRPGIPLFPYGSDELAKAIDSDEAKEVQVMEPQHPSPEELLDAHPFMRSYLTQLVGDFAGGITDGDFWSRYYYRVWLMDVTEARRHLLTARFAAKQKEGGDGPLESPSPGSVDWLGDSDDGQADVPASIQKTPAAAVDPVVGETPTLSRTPNTKTQTTAVGKTPEAGGAKQRRRGRKANDRTEKKTVTRTDTKTEAPVMPSSDSAVLSTDETATRPQQQTCESDGSSSIVVLGNGEEEIMASPPGDETCRQYTTEAIVHSSAEPSDEWSDVVEEGPTTPAAGGAPDQPNELAADQDKSETDEWEEWS